jgi:hypothetical protein
VAISSNVSKVYRAIKEANSSLLRTRQTPGLNVVPSRISQVLDIINKHMRFDVIVWIHPDDVARPIAVKASEVKISSV